MDAAQRIINVLTLACLAVTFAVTLPEQFRSASDAGRGPVVMVRFNEPGGLMIGWQTDDGLADNQLVTPARKEFSSGATYRLKFSNLPGEPHCCLYPQLVLPRVSPETEQALAKQMIPMSLSAADLAVIDQQQTLTKTVWLPTGSDNLVVLTAPQTVPKGELVAVLRLETADVVRTGSTLPPYLAGKVRDGRQGETAPPLAAGVAVDALPIIHEPSPTLEATRPDVREVIKAFPELTAAPQPAEPLPAGPANGTTYAGRTYAEWRVQLFQETQSGGRLQTVPAIATLGANGHAQEAARDLLAVLGTMPAPMAATDEEALLIDALCKGLMRIGPNGVSVLVETLQNASATDLQRNTAATCLGATGHGARTWCPALLRTVQTADARTRGLARTALRGQSPVPESLLSALSDELERSDPAGKVVILDLLREMGTDTRRATGVVLKQLSQPDPQVREAAVAALEASGFFVACQAGELADYGVTSAGVRNPELLPGYRSALDLLQRQALQEATAATVRKIIVDLTTTAKPTVEPVSQVPKPAVR